MECGTPQCETLPTTRTTTTTTTESTVDELNGATCDAYVDIMNSNPGFESGNIVLKVPTTMNSWQIQVCLYGHGKCPNDKFFANAGNG